MAGRQDTALYDVLPSTRQPDVRVARVASCRLPKEKGLANTCQQALKSLVPKRGLEPPRLSALVPETSASTNSATWASQEALNYTVIFPVFERVLQIWVLAHVATRLLSIQVVSRVQKKKACQLLRRQAFMIVVPKRGLEPPRLSALVPETSASTNSATWASQETASIAFKYFRKNSERKEQPVGRI